jgi:hypothetical protein
LKPGDAIWITTEFLREDLDGNIALQLRIARTKHVTHSARAEVHRQLVRSEMLPDEVRCGHPT